MNFDYLTDESEKTLAPFFSPMMMSTLFHSLWIISAVLLLFWPRQAVSHFIETGQGPITFFVIFTATLVTVSYFALRCGRGEMITPDTMSEYRKEVAVFEKERSYFRYGLVISLMQTGLLIVPFVPLFVLSSSISGIPTAVFFKALSIVYTASFLCRLFGFLVYLLWGRFRMEGYLLARVFFIGFVFVTTVFSPAFSPIRVLYAFSIGLKNIVDHSRLDSYSYYMSAVVPAILFLMLLNNMLVRRHINMLARIHDD